MSAGTYQAAAIGVGIGCTVAGLLPACRRNYWVRKAEKLASRSDIALPGPLIPKVARFLRKGQLSGLLVVWIFAPLMMAALGDPYGRRDWGRWLPWLVIGLPILTAGFSYAETVWPRWKASGSSRVTHLRRLKVREAFASLEANMTILGAILAASAGGWGLWLASAPTWWWAAFAAASGVSLAAWWVCAKAVMSRPSNASDEIELGWDDLIRFSRVRSTTIGAAWLPALLIFLADWSAATQPGRTAQLQVSLWPFYLLVAFFAVLVSIYQQGRKLWRQAWMVDGSPQ
jgi:hypothetical protein